jgi:hypothetical protein
LCLSLQVGGIAGLFLGAYVADYYSKKGVRNAYFLIPALFSVSTPFLLEMPAGVSWRSASGVRPSSLRCFDLETEGPLFQKLR